MHNKGFTLVELLVTLTIVIIIGAITFGNYSGKKTNTDLSSATQKIVTLLREAQSRTMGGDQNGTAGTGFWGVSLSNATNTAPFYALFYATSAASIASGTAIGYYSLPSSVLYATTSVALGGTLYVYYGNGLLPGVSIGAHEICTGYTCPAGTSTIMIGLSIPSQKPVPSSTISILPSGAVGY